VCHACEDRVVEPWPWRESKIPRRFMKEATAPTDRQIPEPARIKTRSRHRPDAIDTAPIISRSVFQKMRIPNINRRCCAKSGQAATVNVCTYATTSWLTSTARTDLHYPNMSQTTILSSRITTPRLLCHGPTAFDRLATKNQISVRGAHR